MNLSFHFAIFNGTVIGEDFERWAPLLQFHLPVQHHARRHDDQMRAPDALLTCEVREQCDRLDGLPESHFVGENAVEPMFVHRC